MLSAAEARAVDGTRPSAVERPADVDAAAFAVAAARREGLAIVPWGGGTHMALGNRPTRYELALDMRGLDRVRAHAPADLTLTVEAGATLAAVQRFLAPFGQFLPLEAEEPEHATIGGLLAAGVSGPWRAGYGTARDRLLWSETIGSDGTLLRAGACVVKSVAGYDLPKVHIGALGSLGLLVAVCFKLQPLPASRRLLLVACERTSELGALLASLDGPGLEPAIATIAHGDAAWAGPFALGPWVLALGAEGAEPATAWQVERWLALARAVSPLATALHEGPAADDARQALMARRGVGELRMRLVVLPDRLPRLLADLAALAPAPRAVHAEALNGVCRVAWPADEPGRAVLDRAAAIAEGLGGHWLVEACPPAWKAEGLDVWGRPRPDRALMARLKRALDPGGTFCPGRAIGG